MMTTPQTRRRLLAAGLFLLGLMSSSTPPPLPLKTIRPTTRVAKPCMNITVGPVMGRPVEEMDLEQRP